MQSLPSPYPFGVLLLVSALLSACVQDTRVAPLEAKVASLEAKLSDAEKSFDLLKQQVEMNEMFKDWDKVAYLTPGSSGYGVVRMELGHLTVSLTNITPYANGSKVALQFGNLTSATIEGLKAKVEWGPVDAKGTPRNAEAKSRDVTLNESLLSGAWNNTEIVLEGIPPTALGFIRVRDVSHRAIRLRGR